MNDNGWRLIDSVLDSEFPKLTWAWEWHHKEGIIAGRTIPDGIYTITIKFTDNSWEATVERWRGWSPQSTGAIPRTDEGLEIMRQELSRICRKMEAGDEATQQRVVIEDEDSKATPDGEIYKTAVNVCSETLRLFLERNPRAQLDQGLRDDLHWVLVALFMQGARSEREAAGDKVRQQAINEPTNNEL